MSDERHQNGTCECGTPVIRIISNDRFGQLLARTPFVCDGCIARGEEKEAADAEAWRVDREIRNTQRRLHASGLPAQHVDRTLDGMSLDEPPVAAARAWVDAQPITSHAAGDGFLLNDDAPARRGPDGSGLLLTGPVGVGKTHLAAATTGTLIRRGARAHWMSGPLLFARLQAGLGTDDHSRIMSILTGRDALVIDDLDKTRPTAYAAENVFLAVDGRVSNLVPLLVTTNLSVAELAQHWPQPFGEAIASRLAGYCSIVHMTGNDRRVAA